jgi:hypothetical protein
MSNKLGFTSAKDSLKQAGSKLNQDNAKYYDLEEEVRRQNNDSLKTAEKILNVRSTQSSVMIRPSANQIAVLPSNEDMSSYNQSAAVAPEPAPEEDNHIDTSIDYAPTCFLSDRREIAGTPPDEDSSKNMVENISSPSYRKHANKMTSIDQPSANVSIAVSPSSGAFKHPDMPYEKLAPLISAEALNSHRNSISKTPAMPLKSQSSNVAAFFRSANLKIFPEQTKTPQSHQSRYIPPMMIASPIANMNNSKNNLLSVRKIHEKISQAKTSHANTNMPNKIQQIFFASNHNRSQKEKNKKAIANLEVCAIVISLNCCPNLILILLFNL